jgi:cation transport ATPase
MRIEEAVSIGRCTVRIARQSIVAGLVLSGSAMVVAALGYIPPTIGALLQEAIDVAVIANALRAAGAGR